LKYLETKHERNAARITFLIAVILLLLLFVMGPQYIDPPIEYGVAVNFGTTDLGRGNQPLSEPKPAVNDTKIQEEKAVPSQTEPKKALPESEEVLTQKNAEAIAMKKQREAELRAKAEAERLEKERREAEERKRREQEEKKRKLDNLIGGVKNAEGKDTGGEGPDTVDRNKGQRDEKPYAPSYFGDSGTGKDGVGFGLGGRDRIDNDKFEPDCNEEGRVVVEIRVDRTGKVIKATPGIKGTKGLRCLFEAAKKTALSFKFSPDKNAPKEQIGFVSVNFTLSQ
jgi:outer membrane biosynthesis protein TonB